MKINDCPNLFFGKKKTTQISSRTSLFPLEFHMEGPEIQQALVTVDKSRAKELLHNTMWWLHVGFYKYI